MSDAVCAFGSKPLLHRPLFYFVHNCSFGALTWYRADVRMIVPVRGRGIIVQLMRIVKQPKKKEICSMEKSNSQQSRRRVEVFSAGCATCNDTVKLVREIAGEAHEVRVHDMQKAEVAQQAK